MNIIFVMITLRKPYFDDSWETYLLPLSKISFIRPFTGMNPNRSYAILSKHMISMIHIGVGHSNVLFIMKTARNSYFNNASEK